MLQDCPVSPPLGTATDLSLANQHISWGPSLEAEEWFPGAPNVVGRVAQSGGDAEAIEGLDQAAVNGLIKPVTVGCQWMGTR